MYIYIPSKYIILLWTRLLLSTIIENWHICFSYEPLGSVITYDKGGGGSATYRTTTFGSSVTSYGWDSVSQDKDSEHALHAIIIPSILTYFVIYWARYQYYSWEMDT